MLRQSTREPTNASAHVFHTARDKIAHKAFRGRDTELSRIAHEMASADEAHKTEAGQYIKAAVFGGLDGIVTTFAVVASVTGANLPTGVVIVMVGTG